MSARASAVLLLALAAGLWTSPASAEPTAAAAAFDEGIGHYRRKAYSAAAESFFRAFRLEPTADAAYNAGLAWQLASKPALAATAYQVALGMELEPGAAADARARIGKLAPELGRIEVSAPDGAKVSVPPFSLEANHAVFYLEPGRHELGVTLRGGGKRTRKVEAGAGRTTVVLVEETKPKARDDVEVDTPKPAPRAEQASSGAYATAGWVSLGFGAAAGGLAVVLGLSALSARDDYNASGHRDAEARSRAERLRTATNVAWGVAGLATLGGVGLLVFAPGPESSARAFPSGVSLSGTF